MVIPAPYNQKYNYQEQECANERFTPGKTSSPNCRPFESSPPTETFPFPKKPDFFFESLYVIPFFPASATKTANENYINTAIVVCRHGIASCTNHHYRKNYR